MHAAAWAVGGQASGKRRGGSDPEIGPLVAAVGEQDPRADRKHIAIAVTPDLVGADVADQPVMAAEALPQLATDAERIARFILRERARFDRRLDPAGSRTDVFVLPPARQIHRRPERKPILRDNRDSGSVI